MQQVKIGDVKLVHDDTTRANWKLVVVKLVNKRADGLIPLANICTVTGKTNRPIAYLYPLEITTPKQSTIVLHDHTDQ